jgi:hypothetical protein
MSFIGMLPIGALASGGLAHITGVRPVFLASGVVALAMGYVLKRKLPHLREKAQRVLTESGRLAA